MGMFDKAKEAADKVKDVTEKHADKLGDVIDKGADKLDEKTGGKHSDKIDSAVDAIQDPGGATSPEEEPPGRPTP
ncbi:MAG TPA: antitoxin [Acidimicrobiales bacterium]|nr:antitoxin [Acidimicrobiales bacterium]